MTDYISRESVLMLVQDSREVCANPSKELAFIREDILALPAADVREVVTCGECKYADSFSPTCTEATFPLKCLSIRYGGVYPNWFCEHGERAQKTNHGVGMGEES